MGWGDIAATKKWEKKLEEMKEGWFAEPNWYLAAFWGDPEMLGTYAEQTQPYGGCEAIKILENPTGIEEGDFGYALVLLGGLESQPEEIRKALARLGVFLKLDKGPIPNQDLGALRIEEAI